MVMVSNAEIEKLFGWKKGKAGVYASRNVLPEPVQVLACGKLWDLDDILTIAKVKGWDVDESELVKIFNSINKHSDDERESLNAEIKLLREQAQEMKKQLAKVEKEKNTFNLVVNEYDEEYRQLHSKIIEMKEQYAQLAYGVKRLKEEEKNLIEWITTMKR
ncbi:hypothetical protein ABHN11_24735 [Brevibacillus centrosporus]|uniref:hypothetical protein n=1 Tax=Brevibacillus centrosporus TaxID=54910 RepID=UPI003D1F0429